MTELTISPQDQSATGAAAKPATRLEPIITGNQMLNGNGLLGQFSGFLKQPAISKALPLIGFLAITGLAVLAWLALREPPQRDLFRGLPDSDKAAVAAALESSNIAYQLDNATGALSVSEQDYHQAKIELAAQGLPKSAPSGDEMLSSLPMGASRAVETEKLRGAREMDLARSIEAIDAVLSARVHLAMDPPSIFIRDRNEPAASVILQLASGARLADSQVEAIVHLVGSSVSGLAPEHVSVVDQDGRLLSESGTNSALEESEQQLRLKENIEERYRRSLATMLTPIIGRDNFVAEVSADVDFSERQATSESFPADESRIRSERRSMVREENGTAPPAGIPGAIANAPPLDAEVNPEFDENGNQQGQAQADRQTMRNEEIARNFELGREVAVTKNAVGNVQRVSVAVALRNLSGGKERSAKELEEIEKLIKGAMGFDAARGDQVAVSSRSFQPISADEKAPWYEAGWVSLLVRNLSALLVALALIFGIGRPLLKRFMQNGKGKNNQGGGQNMLIDGEDTRLNLSPAAQAQLGQQSPLGAAPPRERVTLDMINAAQNYQTRAILIQDFVKQNPDHATLVVRDLLRSASQAEEKEAANV